MTAERNDMAPVLARVGHAFVKFAINMKEEFLKTFCGIYSG